MVIRKGWTAYAAVLTAAVVLGEAANVEQGSLDARTPANWVLSAVLLIATWGYALRRPIGAHRYWGPAFWVVLIATGITLVPVLMAGPAAVVMVAILLPLLAPAFYAAYRYAYRSPELWPAPEETP
jgi:FtsH-binding integral membrane protein